jgi:hypothetical protein
MSSLPQPHDPNIPGPFDVCLRCYRPQGRQRGYCLTCGQHWGHLAIWEDHQGLECDKHPSRNAVGFCCLCGKPGCGECIDEDAHGYDLQLGAKLHRCAACLTDSASREASFLSKLQTRKVCIKHKNLPWNFRCACCSTPLCESCTYFEVTGLFQKKVGTTSYCLVCFRRSYFPKKTKRWASGLDARAANTKQ